MSLLVDIMTYKGYLMSIDRHGINRSDIGPLAKCSFEETTDQLLKASIFGESDKVTGISSNVMLGQIAPCGTGLSQILLDEHRLSELYVPNPEDTKPIVKTEVIEKDTSIECNKLQFCFNLDYDNIKPDTNTEIHPIKLIVV